MHRQGNLFNDGRVSEEREERGGKFPLFLSYKFRTELCCSPRRRRGVAVEGTGGEEYNQQQPFSSLLYVQGSQESSRCLVVLLIRGPAKGRKKTKKRAAAEKRRPGDLYRALHAGLSLLPPCLLCSLSPLPPTYTTVFIKVSTLPLFLMHEYEWHRRCTRALHHQHATIIIATIIIIIIVIIIIIIVINYYH